MKQVFPFLRLLPVLLLGWWIPGQWNLAAESALPCLSGFFSLLLLVLAYHRRGWLAYAHRWVFGFTAACMLLVAGIQLGQHRVERAESPHHFSRYSDAKAWLLYCPEPARVGASGSRLIASVIAVKDDSGLRPVKGKVVLYVPDSVRIGLNDRLWMLTPPRPLKHAVFPGTFDFAGWLAGRGVYHECRVRRDNFAVAGQESSPALNVRFHLWRERLLAVFREAGLRDAPWAVMSALVLGYDDAVESDVMQAFSATGTLHVLSVSGLHVGLVYGAIRLLLGFLNKRTFGRRLQQVLSLVFIWLYALLTGASPAVLRSAAMLSLVLGSNLLDRPAAVWNSLAASVFFLTVWDPSLPGDVGFQLSYAAVAGILALYPWLRAHGPWHRPALQRAWEFLSVSIAAQWFTFPLGLYYFHQFPNYFLLTNALIIPLSTVAMFAGLGLLVLGPMAGIGTLLGSLVQGFMEYFLVLVHWMGKLPNAQCTGVWISGFQLGCLGILVVTIFRFIVTGKGKHAVWSLSALVICMGDGLRIRQEHTSGSDFSVLPVRGSAYVFREGRRAVLLWDSASAASVRIDRQIQDHLSYRGIHPGDCKRFLLSADIGWEESGGLLVKRGNCLVTAGGVYWLTDGIQPVGNEGMLLVHRGAERVRWKSIRTEGRRVILDGSIQLFSTDTVHDCYAVSHAGYYLAQLPAQAH